MVAWILVVVAEVVERDKSKASNQWFSPGAGFAPDT